MSDIDSIRNKIRELEKIPLYDVHGGRQRNSNENELLAKLRAMVRVFENAG